ncbi:MAG TPA: NUDIX domain-containing protein [Victivallales bacterium]|nr:NUDIX domain-containing protein [Victivallales bacterium]HRR05806.1 NUDIX domain-containing protein [Victivallales bacterium]HRR28761.1 NUDIX domain-containing protein [Victivallales bacterium]HRU02297.1 NUDIX domain-containing protein [Victivallales bacterium]
MKKKSIEDEIFEIVDENDNIIGKATRTECHGNPSLIHRTVHVVVFNSKGEILLQKRSQKKDIQPGKWDTAVGGHLMPGEDYETAAYRELAEELGVNYTGEFNFLFFSKIRNKIESENTKVFSILHDGPFSFNKEEIEEIRFWNNTELKASIGKNIFTPNLESELIKIFKLQKI